MTDLTQPLAAHAAGFDPARLTGDDIAHTALNLADALACIIGGSSAPGVPETREFLHSVSASGDAKVFGTGTTLPALAAAQANATAGHALDFDDTLDLGGGMHAGTSVHSAALAIADELGGVSGREYVSAVATGLDVAVRLALAPTQDFGWHRTSAFGIFGVTVAVGRLLHLSTEQMANALGIAYSQASGNRQCIPDAALSKRLQAGFGARDGITAVMLARAGLTGASNAFEGRDGFFNLYQRGEYNRDTVLNGLGEALMSKEISHKPYPCGRNLHALLDAALDVRGQGGGDGISAIQVELPPQAASRANMAFPTQVVEAQFSVPFAVALALATGAADVASFDQPQEVSQSVRNLFEKVTIQPNEALSGFGAIVSATYDNGGVVRSEVHVAKGNPEKPLTPDDVSRKFADCNQFAGQPLADDRIERIIDLVLSRPLTELESTNEITSAMATS